MAEDPHRGAVLPTSAPTSGVGRMSGKVRETLRSGDVIGSRPLNM